MSISAITLITRFVVLISVYILSLMLSVHVYPFLQVFDFCSCALLLPFAHLRPVLPQVTHCKHIICPYRFNVLSTLFNFTYFAFNVTFCAFPLLLQLQHVFNKRS